MFWEFSWLNIAYVLLVTHITIVTVTVYLHRCVAHRSLTISNGLEHFFRFWSWLTTGQNTQEWAAVHRKHHAFCEKENDPHSPKIHGIWNVLFKGVILYKKEAANQETIAKYGKFTPYDKIELFYRKFSFAGLIAMGALTIVLFGWHGIWMYAIQIWWIPFWAAGVINGVGHHKGYRNFNTTDGSTNLVPWGILIGGEELHNNHHAYPTSAKLSVKWYEFDIGWMWINIFKFFGLAKVNKVIDLPKMVKNKSELREDSLELILSHKFMIFSIYQKSTRKDVIRYLKNLKTENKEFKQHSIRKLSKIFYDISGNLKDAEKQLLNLMIKNENLNKIFIFKQKLLSIWESKQKNINDLKSDLFKIYQNMINSNINSVRDFSYKMASLSYST